MKNRILKVTILGCFLIAGMANCVKTHKQKVKSAQIEVVEAKQDLQQSRADSAEYAKYKAEVEIILKENKMKIAALKANMKSVDKESQTLYNKMIDELDQKNSELELKIKEFQKDSKENWDNFRLDFNKQMDQLGKSISEMAHKNMKKNK